MSYHDSKLVDSFYGIIAYLRVTRNECTHTVTHMVNYAISCNSITIRETGHVEFLDLFQIGSNYDNEVNTYLILVKNSRRA